MVYFLQTVKSVYFSLSEMTKTLLFILLVAPGLLVAQNEVDSQGRKQGEWTRKWENGKTRYKGQFKDDKPVGKFLYWYETGEPQTVLTYTGNGAYSKTYNKNGKISARGKYVNQLKDSVWVFYDEKGRVRSKNSYKEGLLDGEQVTYNFKGKLMEVIHYKDDKKHGKWTQFYPGGKLKVEGYWDMGYPSGKITYYREEGTYEMRGQYKFGERNGWWRYYDDNGKEEKKVYYRYGEKLEGKALETYLENVRKLKAEGKDIDKIEKERLEKRK